MMNMQNLISQLGNATNPMSLMMSMLNPSQKQTVNMFQNKTTQDQCQAIADYCNKNGIDKSKLQEIINMLNNK